MDHRVDRRAAAQHPAAGVVDRAPGKVLVRLGSVAPVGAGIGDRVEVADRDVDPEIVVLAAGLEQQHPRFGPLREAVGEQAAGAACANNYIVIAAEVLHPVPPFGIL
jgi:hypothetical protein